ncbi:MAG: hypothetical protein Q3999_08510, partial [Buchananella hordeovulneris]|nr:hypothetical protein [Buchananella hordeovulneris]
MLSAPVAAAAVNTAVSVRDVSMETLVNDAGSPACTNTQARDGSRVCVKWKWDASTANPQPGQTFYLGIPNGFQMVSDGSYNLQLPVPGPIQTGEQLDIATCRFLQRTAAAPGKVECTFNQGVARFTGDDKPKLKGSGTFIVRVHRQDDSSYSTFDFNGTLTPVSNPTGRPILPPQPVTYEADWPDKSTVEVRSDSTDIFWTLAFNTENLTSISGSPLPSPLVITELAKPGHHFAPDTLVDLRILNNKSNPGLPDTPRVGSTDESLAPVTTSSEYRLVDIDRTVSADGQTMTLRLTARDGAPLDPETNYLLTYRTLPSSADGLAQPGLVYASSSSFASISMSSGGEASFTVPAAARPPLDPGFGSFEINSRMDGPAAVSVPTGTPIKLRVKWTLPAGKRPSDYEGWTPPAENPFTFTAPIGHLARYANTPKPFPFGTALEITVDQAGSATDTVQWDLPRFESDSTFHPIEVPSFSIGSGSYTSFQMTNRATLIPPAAVSVGGSTWLDRNGNGQRDEADWVMSDVSLRLRTSESDAQVLDVFGKPVAPTKSRYDGTYQFALLPPLPAGQRYRVVADVAAGFGAVAPGANGAIDAASSTVSLDAAPLTQDGASDQSLSFGFYKLPASIDIEKYTGSWSGIKFNAGVPELVGGEPANKPAGDHDTLQTALSLDPAASLPITLTVTNTGRSPLRRLQVTENVSSGSSIANLVCRIDGQDYRAANNSVTAPSNWVLQPGKSFHCSATMRPLGTQSQHVSRATVTALPVGGGEQVKNTDTFNVVKKAKPTPTPKPKPFTAADVTKC